ncbi:adenosine receptor A3-like [Sceloporus undulatus]|uniref:adenosine receptor A3-like n=1 Tax=Sceloporus undulatus TaxID=8520 RepID=UPI001C4D85AE|nr:adenosine receptor A3-like [Sceloporus undulatus]
MPDVWENIYIAFESMIAVLAILGNILVIWVLKLNRTFQKSIFYFIISLAVADIAVGLVMPAAIVVSLGIQMPYDACLFMCCLLVAFTQASIMSLLAIAIDRYLRVRLLIRYKLITTEKRIRMALGTVWLLSLLVGFIPMFGWAEEKPGNSSNVECKFRNVMKMDYMVYLSFFTGTLAPLILMCVLYTKIFCIIRSKLELCSGSGKGQGISYRHELRIAKSLSLVLFLFAVCWLPMCILNCLMHFYSILDIPEKIVYLAILLSHSNSVMNPIVYAFRIKKFRKTCIQILRTYVLQMDPETDVPDGHSSSEPL